jgi:hypothetical protein
MLLDNTNRERTKPINNVSGNEIKSNSIGALGTNISKVKVWCQTFCNINIGGPEASLNQKLVLEFDFKFCEHLLLFVFLIKHFTFS